MPPGYQAYVAAPAYKFASWGARVGCHLLNGLVSGLFAIPAFIAVFTAPRETKFCTHAEELRTCEVPTTVGWAIIFGLGLIGAIAFVTLYGRAIAKSGQFVGHKAAGVRIIDASTGDNIGAWKAVFRFFLGHWIDGAFCYLGYLWPLWDKDKQTWSDKIFGTYSITA